MNKEQEIQWNLYFDFIDAANAGASDKAKSILDNPQLDLKQPPQGHLNLLHAARYSEELFAQILQKQNIDVNAENPAESILSDCFLAHKTGGAPERAQQKIALNNLFTLMKDERFQFPEDISKLLIEALQEAQISFRNQLPINSKDWIADIEAYRKGLMNESEADQKFSLTSRGQQKLQSMEAELVKIQQEEANVLEKAQKAASDNIINDKNSSIDDFFAEDTDELDDAAKTLGYQIEEKTKKIEAFKTKMEVLKGLEQFADKYWQKNPVHWERLDTLKTLVNNEDIRTMVPLQNKAERTWLLPDYERNSLSPALDYLTLNEQQFDAFNRFSKEEQKLLLEGNIRAYEDNTSQPNSLFLASKDNNFNLDEPSPRYKHNHEHLNGKESILNDVGAVFGSGWNPNFDNLDFVLKHITKMDSEALLKSVSSGAKHPAYTKLLAEIALHPAFDKTMLNAYEVEVLKKDERAKEITDTVHPDINARKNGVNIALQAAVAAQDFDAFNSMLANPELVLIGDTKTPEELKRLHENSRYAKAFETETMQRRKKLTEKTMIFSQQEGENLPSDLKEKILALPKLFQYKLKHGEYLNTSDAAKHVNSFETAAGLAQVHGKDAVFSWRYNDNHEPETYWNLSDKKALWQKLKSQPVESDKPSLQSMLKMDDFIVDSAMELIEHRHITGELVTDKEKREKIEDIKSEIRIKQEKDLEHSYLVKKDGTVKVYDRSPQSIIENPIIRTRIQGSKTKR